MNTGSEASQKGRTEISMMSSSLSRRTFKPAGGNDGELSAGEGTCAAWGERESFQSADPTACKSEDFLTTGNFSMKGVGK